jgi:hypothetical protein
VLSAFVAVLLCALVAADVVRPLRVTAALCQNRACTERSLVGFEPARVDLQIGVPLDARNRRLTYGLVCDAEVVRESSVGLDGHTDAPLFVQTYRDVGAGECQVMAVVYRSDGSRETGRSVTLLIRSRLGE